jgi:thioredoxin reductase
MYDSTKLYDYVVMGGGLGGIISCFILLKKYPDIQLIWVDKDGFTCGDLKKYSCVYANTPMKKMSKFLKELVPFYQDCLTLCTRREDCEHYCILSDFVDELKNLTRILQNNPRVDCLTDTIQTIDNTDQDTHTIKIFTQSDSLVLCKKVVMATGCYPKTLDLNTPHIDLYKALNKCIMTKLQYQNKKIVVFGNRHSGILVLKNLYELGYKYITNIVRSDIKVPEYVEEDDRELYDQIGIRGFTLRWAQANLLPNKTNIRIIKKNDDEEAYNTVIQEADYIIYAIGLEQNNIIDIKYSHKSENNQKCYSNIDYNAKTGVIDENIYGMGIGFLNYSIYKDVYECEAGMYEFYEQGMRIL